MARQLGVTIPVPIERRIRGAARVGAHKTAAKKAVFSQVKVGHAITLAARNPTHRRAISEETGYIVPNAGGGTLE